MGRHSGDAYEAAPDEWRPVGSGDDGHSPVTRRSVLGILGVAGAAAACSAGVAVVANKPEGAPGPAGSAAEGAMPAGAPARPVGLAAGAAGVTAPTGVKSETAKRYQKQSADAYSPQKAPVAPRTELFLQRPTVHSLDQTLHVGRRLTFGLTPALVKEIKGMGRAAWVESQLKLQEEDPELTALLDRYQLLAKSPTDIAQMFKDNDNKPDDQKLDYHAVSDQLVAARYARSFWSRNQLFEKVCDVFRSVLHTPAFNDKCRLTVGAFDRDVIQKNAFGKYLDMLEAFRKDPAARQYLDNVVSDGVQKDDQGFKINQNWGRECLELFSVRITDYLTGKVNYDPRVDVVQMSFALTGLTVDNDTQKSVYKPEMHYRGAIKVMGYKAANTDPAKGDQLSASIMRYLARHPSTASNLAADFARAFLVDAPPKALVKRMADAYMKNDTAIVPMLRVLFSSREFALSVGQKYRTPEEYVAAGMRVVGAKPAPDAKDALYKDGTLNGLRDLTYQIGQVGGSSLEKQSPDGQAFHKEAFLNGAGILFRWNASMSVAGQWWKGIERPELETLYGGAKPATYGEALGILIRRLTLEPPNKNTTAALLGFLGKTAATPLGGDLSLGGKLFQVVPLILDAPEGLTYR
jgi:uncharacterized protein (DUF1800 family)